MQGAFKRGRYVFYLYILPVVDDFLVKGVNGLKGLSSVGVDLAIGAIRSSDEIVDILRLICHASDNAADLSRYLDDVAEMILSGGNARLTLEGGEILNGNSKIVIDIYDDTGNVIPASARWMTLMIRGW